MIEIWRDFRKIPALQDANQNEIKERIKDLKIGIRDDREDMRGFYKNHRHRSYPPAEIIDERWTFFRWIQGNLVAGLDYFASYGPTIEPNREKIHIDPVIQISRRTSERTIRRYAEAFERLPSVVVFETADGLVLSDGFHRLAAAEHLGKKEIEADVKRGTYKDAQEFAITANVTNGEPLTAEERDEGVRRLKELHPTWSLRKLADAMSVSCMIVKRALDVEEVRSSLGGVLERITPSHCREIASAPREFWQRLAKAIEAGGWSVNDTIKAVKALNDPKLSMREKALVLAGGARARVHAQDMEKDDQEQQSLEVSPADAVRALRRALICLATARQVATSAIIATASAEILQSWSQSFLMRQNS